ncbi:MAG: helix-turn-helix domain-containing protein [Candidatus Riflebacteria bacterium]|nr:helix-turn-helix domain-containing protein [Candidatus Riflebacteria bacterium]
MSTRTGRSSARQAEAGLLNHLRELRTAAHLSQQELAKRTGLTRQAINAIEGGHYLPNTSVALQLARVFGCRVEELFRLAEETPLCPVEMWQKPERGPTRVVVGRVRGRLVAHPLTHGLALCEGFSPADGLLESDGPQSLARLFVDPSRLETTAFLMGCDPGLGLLGAHLERARPEMRLSWLPAPSRTALAAVAKGGVHIAGSHLRDARSGEFNLVHARKALAGGGGLVVAFARWEQGLMVRRGNPKHLRGIEDLARPGVTIVNRAKGAGSRDVLDTLLARAGLPAERVAGYQTLAASHMAVARAIAAGAADAGVGLAAVAVACELDFVPLTEVHFDLVIPGDAAEHPAVQATLDLLQSRRLREDLAALPGYDVTRTGTVLARFGPSASTSGGSQ